MANLSGDLISRRINQILFDEFRAKRSLSNAGYLERARKIVVTHTIGGYVHPEFDERTAANMEVALTRACAKLRPDQDNHESRKAIGNAIIECARAGKTTLDDLTQAGHRALRAIPR